MSSTTSAPNSILYSAASRDAYSTASGWSPFTCRIGHWIDFAMSVQYSPEYACAGVVVNPIWLFTITWIVPPVR